MERRIAAIFAADMVGYSRLMEADEVGTLARQKRHRAELIDPKISAHGGTIIKLTGDGMIAEFPSVVEAVQCAVAIQSEMEAREAGISEDRRILYRIAINLGDVIFDEGDIYGDGVNIAARLEALAEPGGVVVSGTAYEHLKSNVNVGYEDLGEQQVKNIERPVRAWRVLTDPTKAGQVIAAPTPRSSLLILTVTSFLVLALGLFGYWWLQRADFAAADPAKYAFELPEKPSIAVLPFDNLSGDPDNDFVSDGLTESIIATLAKHPKLFVIARNSSFTYKGVPVKVQNVAQELGVRFVLEGSMQMSDKTIRVTAQLVDALDGRHVWAEQYDGNLSADSLLEVQDEIVAKILVAMDLELLRGSRAGTLLEIAKGDIETLSMLIEAEDEFVKFSPSSVARTEEIAHRLLEKNPSSVPGLRWLVWVNWYQVTFGFAKDPEDVLRQAREFANRAHEIDPESAQVYMATAWIDLREEKYEAAIKNAGSALQLEPGNGRLNALTGWIYAASGYPERSVQYFKDALRFEPFPPDWVPSDYSTVLLMTGKLDEARDVAEAVLRKNWNLGAHYTLAYLDVKSGNLEAAKGHVQAVLDILPIASVAGRVQIYSYIRDKTFFNDYLDTLRAAGLPELPPPRPGAGN